LTAQVIDKDGWLRVGDLAILQNNGAIEIIERVDELKKLQNGQYIAP
jgi:long-subunit acyl-CoA synthetase (AMP-forming)